MRCLIGRLDLSLPATSRRSTRLLESLTIAMQNTVKSQENLLKETAMTYEDAEAHAKDWIEAWNSHDLERIMSFYSNDVVFEAETVRVRWKNPDGRLVGIAELRKHFALGLELAPQLRFQFEQLLLAPSGYAILYKRENGNRVIDCVTMNDAGQAAKVTAYYGGVQR
jgi:SnoaL-like domain